MPRPFKCRRVSYLPGVTFFKPAGIPMRGLGEMQVSLEEAEALRLKDLEGLDQEPAAAKMPEMSTPLVARRQPRRHGAAPAPPPASASR